MVAFIGPSLSRQDAARLCPGLDIRPPVRGDELYCERERGAWGFLIIDGIFAANQAVSPREVVDVLNDGALVVGASSMGALRAADCWPAGAIGIGLIYRLYRSGVLENDDEVAVAVRADETDVATSVPLVNVRYAIARAVRRQLLDRDTARAVFAVAASIFYAERTWHDVLRKTGVNRPEVLEFCTRIDLKRTDAERALAYVRQLMVHQDTLAAAHCRANDKPPFERSANIREREYDVYGGTDPEDLQTALVDWLVGSGRIVRYGLSSSEPLGRTPEELASRLWQELVRGPVPRIYTRRVWRALARTGELDPELMRMRAVGIALTEAKRRHLPPRPRDIRIARREIANNYGFVTWDALIDGAPTEAVRLVISAAAEKLAIAKRVRDAWFNPHLDEPAKSVSVAHGAPERTGKSLFK